MPPCGRGWVLQLHAAVHGRTGQSESFCHRVVVVVTPAAAINVEIVFFFFPPFKLILSASFIDSMTKSSVSVCVAIRSLNHSAVQSILKKKKKMVLVNNYFCFDASQRSE